MQREVLSLPGPIVALAGHGSQLAVAVHLGMPLPGNQNIGVAVFNVGRDQKGALSHPLPNFQPIPLAPRSTLSWLGFTDENNVRAQRKQYAIAKLMFNLKARLLSFGS
jgi:chromosome transmission fidelity protein 4